MLPQLRMDLIDENDIKDDVRKKLMKPIIDQLQDVLKRNPSFQNKEKTTGNGF